MIKLGRLCILGVGLVGGSIAAAARKYGVATEIVGAGTDIDDLQHARAAGLLDKCYADDAEAIESADMVVMSRPVDVILHQLPRLLPLVAESTLVTDAGSTKEMIVRCAEEGCGGSGASFVGSHPMAGSDRSGWRHAEAAHLKGSATYVTVTKRTVPANAAKVARFWRALGCRVIFAHPTRHDELVAMLSHVPHLTAVALIEQLSLSGEDPNVLRLLAGNGLRDTTRIARANPEIWEQICLQNARTVAERLDDVGGRLHDLARAIRNRDAEALRRILQKARELRTLIGDRP